MLAVVTRFTPAKYPAHAAGGGQVSGLAPRVGLLQSTACPPGSPHSNTDESCTPGPDARCDVDSRGTPLHRDPDATDGGEPCARDTGVAQVAGRNRLMSSAVNTTRAFGLRSNVVFNLGATGSASALRLHSGPFVNVFAECGMVSASDKRVVGFTAKCTGGKRGSCGPALGSGSRCDGWGPLDLVSGRPVPGPRSTRVLKDSPP
jgi:hypothetical protein